MRRGGHRVLAVLRVGGRLGLAPLERVVEEIGEAANDVQHLLQLRIARLDLTLAVVHAQQLAAGVTVCVHAQVERAAVCVREEVVHGGHGQQDRREVARCHDVDLDRTGLQHDVLEAREIRLGWRQQRGQLLARLVLTVQLMLRIGHARHERLELGDSLRALCQRDVEAVQGGRSRRTRGRAPRRANTVVASIHRSDRAKQRREGQHRHAEHDGTAHGETTEQRDAENTVNSAANSAVNSAVSTVLDAIRG